MNQRCLLIGAISWWWSDRYAFCRWRISSPMFSVTLVWIGSNSNKRMRFTANQKLECVVIPQTRISLKPRAKEYSVTSKSNFKHALFHEYTTIARQEKVFTICSQHVSLSLSLSNCNRYKSKGFTKFRANYSNWSIKIFKKEFGCLILLTNPKNCPITCWRQKRDNLLRQGTLPTPKLHQKIAPTPHSTKQLRQPLLFEKIVPTPHSAKKSRQPQVSKGTFHSRHIERSNQWDNCKQLNRSNGASCCFALRSCSYRRRCRPRRYPRAAQSSYNNFYYY